MTHGDLGDLLSQAPLPPTPRDGVMQVELADHPPADPLLRELGSAIEELLNTGAQLRLQHRILEASRRALADEAEAYRSLFIHLPAPCLVTDTAGVIRDANRAAARFLGVAEDALAGTPLSLFIPEAGRHEFGRRMSAEPGSDGASWELEMRPAQGGVRTVRASVCAAPRSHHSTGLVWTLHAVDPACGAGEGDLLRAALDAGPVPGCVVDLDGTLVRWNQAAQRHTEWPADMHGRALPVAFASEAEGDPLHGREPADDLEATLTRGDGSRIAVSASLRPLQAGGRMLGTLFSFTPPDERASDAAADGFGGVASTVSAQSLLAPSAAGVPLTDRLRQGIAAGLHLGMVRGGTRLPSVRALAAAAGVDHRAVGAAYRALATDRVVEVRGRQGVFVLDRPSPELPELSETGAWVAGVLTRAADLRVRVGSLPELLRRWTAATRIRCACMESVEDELVTLTEEFVGQWGMDAYPVAAGGGTAASIEQLRGAHLVVSTSFHAGEAEEAARALGIPLVVTRAGPAFARAVAQALARGSLSVLVADPRYVDRLHFLPGSDRLRVHLAADPDSLAAIDPGESVLVTPAARKRLGDRRIRMLLAPSEFLSHDQSPLVASVLVARNGAAPAPEPS